MTHDGLDLSERGYCTPGTHERSLSCRQMKTGVEPVDIAVYSMHGRRSPLYRPFLTEPGKSVGPGQLTAAYP